MKKYFNINFELDKRNFNNDLYKLISDNESSYICVVDSNVLALSYENMQYREVLNNSNINSCDGSSLIFILRLIHKKKFNTYTGPDIFNDYINKPYKHLIIGNTHNAYKKVLNVTKKKCGIIDNIYHLDLPFNSVENFDYNGIANYINELKPQLIWVSLGAPKQEYFMSILKPLINKGVMIGIGAALSFYTGDFKRSKTKLFSLNFTWVVRLFTEPEKQFKRLFIIITNLPKIIKSEYNNKN
jgi:N-acetylglucosaminyldiphosphoundecaprenol N-acetyl-beta-D-mannosaminyltransferase